MDHKLLLKMILLGLSCFSLPSYAALTVVPCHSFYIKNSKLPEGGHYVLLGKERMYYRILGHGSPLIIFSSGTGFPADGWYESGITKSLAKTHRVMTYDRLYT